MSVYFAQCRRGGLIKIGWSHSVPDRLKALKAKLLGALPGGRSIEKATHKNFEHLRVRGEWFKPSSELLGYIRTHAQEHQPDADIAKIIVHVPKMLLTRINKIAEHEKERTGIPLKRTRVIGWVLFTGVEQLEAKRKKRP